LKSAILLIAAKVVQLGMGHFCTGEPMKVRARKSAVAPVRPTPSHAKAARGYSRKLKRWMPVQVAAVCYRRVGLSFEFLLVNTSAGKWTFPKGRLCSWLSPSESAAREALEEAGVLGRIQENSFAYYLDLKRSLGHDNRSREIRIAAYLMEVRSISTPHETHRNPTWFSPEEAKERLAELRAANYSRELGRIIETAIRSLRRRKSSIGLQRARTLFGYR
jgi:8-oxo-dGTP pyrophosphatase MutT (NUDIX family)